MKDFIFGTLATEELRHKHVRNHRAGVSHAYARTPRDPLPGESITVKLSIGPQHPCERAWLYWTNNGSDPVGRHGKASNGHAMQMENSGVEWDTLLWGYIQHYRAIIPAQAADTVVRYQLSGVTWDGEEIPADSGSNYAFYVANDPMPEWSRKAVVYQIFVDRFYPGNGKEWLSPSSPSGFYGGRLEGILEKLDYLADLGVNVLWLTPIFPSPSHHGYDAVDLFDIEPRLGSKTDFINLLKAAHRLDMRILLDFVPNHVSHLHPSFQAAIKDENSPFREWYSFQQWPDQYSTFFGVPSLPQINLRNPAAKQHMLEAASYWLKMGVDGYRVDYAIGPAADFWADFRRATRRVNGECWTFGEVVEPPDSQLNFAGGLDGCLDFNLMEAMRNTFAYGDWQADTFCSYLQRHEVFFPDDFSRPSFLDNHDMNRFLWAAQGDIRRLKLAAMCQFTLSAPPVIYYGTEVGLSQCRDVRQDGRGIPEESRLPMLWEGEQNGDLFSYYRELIRLRKETTHLRQGKAKIMGAGRELIVYQRGENDEILVALNPSDDRQTLELENRARKVLLKTSADGVRVGESELTLEPMEGVVLQHG